MGQYNSKQNKQENINQKKRENFRNISKTIKVEETKKAVLIESFDDCYKQSKNLNLKNNDSKKEIF
jgi:hypothetical protein